MYASLGCDALSAKCTAGSSILGYFMFLGGDTAETPFAKPPFSWFLRSPDSESLNGGSQMEA